MIADTLVKPPVLTLQAPEEVPSGRAEVSELQLMADNQSGLEVTEKQELNAQLPHAGWFTVTQSIVSILRMWPFIQFVNVEPVKTC